MDDLQKRNAEREQLRRVLAQKGNRYKELIDKGAPPDMMKHQMEDMKAVVNQMALLNLELADYDEQERMKGNA